MDWETDLLVDVDPSRIAQVINNLMENAVKYSPDGGEIVTTAQPQGAMLQVSVADQGVGIPQRDLHRVFDRFHRVEGARGRSVEGSGIGLALVRELVGLHGGTVTVESVVDRGSTFTVSIPVGSAHLPADHVHEATEHARAADASALRAHVYAQEAARWLDGPPPAPAEPVSAHAESARDASAAPHPRDPATKRYRILLADDNVLYNSVFIEKHKNVLADDIRSRKKEKET
jgi:anti-sigma regulatory factor (Ser/Thr protein kinase)